MELPRRAALAIAVLTPVLAGCITKNNVELKLSRAWCDRYEECAPASFDESYSSFDNCVDERSDEWFMQHGYDEADDCRDDFWCSFDREQARECRDSIERASCEQLAVNGFQCGGIWNSLSLTFN